jgi:hypothetical protein
MPLRREVRDAGRLVVTVGEGVVNQSEAQAYVEQISLQPIAGSHIDLIDMTDMTELKLTYQGARQVIESIAAHSYLKGSSLVVFLAPADATFGIARMLQMVLSTLGNDAAVVRTRSEADAIIARGSSPE